jgi:hypothetical protein
MMVQGHPSGNGAGEGEVLHLFGQELGYVLHLVGEGQSQGVLVISQATGTPHDHLPRLPTAEIAGSALRYLASRVRALGAIGDTTAVGGTTYGHEV